MSAPEGLIRLPIVGILVDYFGSARHNSCRSQRFLDALSERFDQYVCIYTSAGATSAGVYRVHLASRVSGSRIARGGARVRVSVDLMPRRAQIRAVVWQYFVEPWIDNWRCRER
jgi:hypothetical protein